MGTPGWAGLGFGSQQAYRSGFWLQQLQSTARHPGPHGPEQNGMVGLEQPIGGRVWRGPGWESAEGPSGLFTQLPTPQPLHVCPGAFSGSQKSSRPR